MGGGAYPRFARVAPFAYVTNQDSGTVSVIDTAPREVVAEVEVIRPEDIAVSPDGALITPPLR